MPLPEAVGAGGGGDGAGSGTTAGGGGEGGGTGAAAWAGGASGDVVEGSVSVESSDEVGLLGLGPGAQVGARRLCCGGGGAGVEAFGRELAATVARRGHDVLSAGGGEAANAFCEGVS